MLLMNSFDDNSPCANIMATLSWLDKKSTFICYNFTQKKRNKGIIILIICFQIYDMMSLHHFLLITKRQWLQVKPIMIVLYFIHVSTFIWQYFYDIKFRCSIYEVFLQEIHYFQNYLNISEENWIFIARHNPPPRIK